MPRTTLLLTLTWLWWIHLPTGTVRAQEPPPASPSEPAPTTIWRPKRFPPLYPRPKAAVPQARDTERAPEKEEAPSPPRHTGLLLAGVSIFVTSYLITVVAAQGVRNLHEYDCKAGNIFDPCDDGDLMLIPVAGPFLTGQSLPVQLILSGPQVVSLVMMIAGFFRASRPVPRRERASFEIHPAPLHGGGTLTATLRF